MRSITKDDLVQFLLILGLQVLVFVIACIIRAIVLAFTILIDKLSDKPDKFSVKFFTNEFLIVWGVIAAVIFISSVYNF